uniref:Uncharacterized protein n=1 Tax=Panagrolaimus sp. PS1159 TaxID=55785 RepID=A0AC35FUF6_9BILA
MASESSNVSDFAAAADQKMFLRSKINPEFQTEVGTSVINSCNILKNVTEYTDNSDAVEVDMTQKELEKFVEFHNHFLSTATVTDKDLQWTNAFFKEMPENEFKEFCWKADYLDSQRFLEAAGDYVLSKMEEMEVQQIQEYLNIQDDFTLEERKAMEKHPLEFFNGVFFQQDDAATTPGAAPAAAAPGDQPALQQ